MVASSGIVQEMGTSGIDEREIRVACNMRVAHLTSVHLVRDVRIYQKECRSLYDAGYDVVLVGIGDSFDDPSGPRLVGIHRSRWRAARIASAWIHVLRQAVRTRAGLFHLHDPELIPLGVILKLLGKRVIFDCHEYYATDMLDRAYIPAPLRKFLSVAVHLALRMADRCFDGIVVAAPGMLRDFSNRNATLINNYPEWEIGPAGKRNFKKRPPLIAYAGVIAERRGIREMLDALEIVAQRTEVRLLLAGKFAPPELMDEMRGHPAWRFVDYRGLVPRNEVKLLLEDAVAGLVIFWDIGNHRESSPNKLFEYMAAGLPTIVTDFPTWRILLGPLGASLMVDPRDPKAIAEKICWILANRDEAEQMGRQGQQGVREQFSWKSESKKLIELYGTVLSAHGAVK